MKLSDVDPQIAQLIEAEEVRQVETLSLIPSENIASDAVKEALGSVLTNKYSEGMSGARYYQGNAFVDQIETTAIERAKALFKVPHANVQAHSGSPANSAIYFGLLNPNDTIMGLKLSAGGHLTHGHPNVTFSGKYFKSVQYDVREDGMIDMDEAAEFAKVHKPQIIVVGTTAYPREFEWSRWAEIAESVNAYLLADISHIAGLVVGNVAQTPAPFADVIMCTTHKTLRGPRGALIMATEKGMKKDPELGKKIDRAVFPGLQGGPHNNVTAAIAVCLAEAATPEFKQYAKQIVKNAKALAQALTTLDFKLVTGGTDNHLMVVDLRPQGIIGNIAAEALEEANIVVNRNTVPHDPQSPFFPSGIRIGTPSVTTRGMKEKEMGKIAQWMSQVINSVSHYRLPQDLSTRKQYLKDLQKEYRNNVIIQGIKEEVKKVGRKFRN